MPRKTQLDQKAEKLAGFLSAHGLVAPHDRLVELIRERRDSVAERAGIGPAAAMRYLDDETLRSMAASVAELLADEIPAAGGDPWAGPERLVFPVTQAGRFSWSLGLVVQASLQAGDTDRAVLAVHAVIGLSRIISESEDGASVVFAPKEGLAYTARVLEAAAGSFASGELVIAPPNTLSAAAIGTEMAADAVTIRAMIDTA